MNQELNKTFSDNLNYWLKRRGQTQADLYRKIGVSSSTASDWCNGNKIPRVDKIAEIAHWLMIELSDLIENKERPDDVMNDVLFRLNNDEKFSSVVMDIFSLDESGFLRILEYVELLKK